MFTVENASSLGAQGAAKRLELDRPRPLAQAIWMQDKIRAAVNDKATTPSALAQLARAWDVLEERKAILRGIGAPKPVTAANDLAHKPKSSRTSSESSEEKPK